MKQYKAAPQFKYIVKEEDKMVIAIMTNPIEVCTNRLLREVRCNRYGGDDEMKNIMLDTKFLINTAVASLMEAKTFRGIAKCVDGDTFDVETGKRLAQSKALIKFEDRLFESIKRVVGDINEMYTFSTGKSMVNKFGEMCHYSRLVNEL